MDSIARHGQPDGFAGGDGSVGVSAAPVGGFTGTGIQNVDALIYGARWSPSNITFNFPDPNFYAFETNYFQNLFIEPTVGFQVTANLANAIRYILPNFFGGASGLTFTETAPNTFPDMGIFMGNPIGPGTAVGGIPGFTSGVQAPGDVWFDVANGGDFANPVVGKYSWATIIHELGHALGLKHGHDSSYGFSNQALTADRDSMEFSIMTYRGYIGADPGAGYANAAGSYASTLMMFDIYALQALYGANYNWNKGNSTYTFNPTTGAASINGNFWLSSSTNTIFLTIWDGGGTDTYDFSNYTTDQLIDLRPGQWSVLSQAQLADLGNNHDARGNVFNALQFEGNGASLIENANGGSGADTMIGNSAANRLIGNGGNDSIDGGAGADTMTGGLGNDTYRIDAAADRIVEAANGGTDTLYTTVDYALGTGVAVEVMRTNSAAGTTAIDLTGNELANRLYGNAGANILIGGGGTDLLDGAGGIDTAKYEGSAAITVDLSKTTAQNTGGAGTDTLIDIENLVTGNGADSLTGSTAANLIQSAGGNDTVFGMNGNDTLYGGLGNDSLAGGLGRDEFYGEAGADRFDFNLITEIGKTAATRDVIRDFSHAQRDRIDFSTIDANTLLAGNQAFSFIGGDPFDDTAGELRSRSVGSSTFVEGDVNGDGVMDFQLQLIGVITLVRADFVL